MIRFRGVRFGYREAVPVLDGADGEIGPGLTLLVGPNGCGKTTFLRLAAGIERPDAGRIELDGCDLWGDEVRARRGLAYVPEVPELTPYATLGEILMLVCELRGVPSEQADAVLRTVSLSGLRDRSVREVSQGQRRRAVLAAAMIGRPRIVLLDEPLEALDSVLRRLALEWIESVRASGAAVVVATHDLEPFLRDSVRLATLRAGRPVIADRPAEPTEAWEQRVRRAASGANDDAGRGEESAAAGRD